MNAVDIAIDHPEDESPWAAGYHVELMAGADSVPLGNVPGGGAIGGFGPETIRQAYLTLRTPVGNSGIDWKVGVFDTIIGYESSSDPANPNYTRSYGYTIEPTTETGVLGTYKINDNISVEAGVADAPNADTGFGGLNTSSVYETRKAYLGAIALTAPSSWGWLNGATLNGGIITAPSATTSYYVGATVPTPITALKAGASYDYLDIHNGGGEAWVGGLYASYQLNDKASINVRGEYGQDDTGILYGAFDTFPIGVSRNAFEEATATLQYNLWANVLSRLEVRWDHVEHGTQFGPNNEKSNDFLVALNLIYQF